MLLHKRLMNMVAAFKYAFSLQGPGNQQMKR